MKTAALNESKYGELLTKALPHVIHNDKELEHFTAALLDLDNLEHPGREERALAELLTTLIEKYEQENYALRKASPVEMIQFLMEQRGLSAKDLTTVLGSRGVTSDVIHGKRNIGPATAVKLGQFFGVAPQFFIDWKAASA